MNVAACSAISNLLIFLSAISPADPGDLDPTFGTGGLVTADFAGDSEGALALVIQADSKVVVAGWSSTGPTFDFALARYNTDGSLDTSFGTGGLVTTDVAPDAYDQAFALAIQDDGKIIAVGFVDNGADDDFALIRYNTDGSLDTSFGENGVVTTDFSSGEDRAFGVAIQADGKIVAAGTTNVFLDAVLARYNTDGTLDDTFGTGGLVAPYLGVQPSALVIQSDGKIVVSGVAIDITNDFALFRLNTDGSVDTTFGDEGLVTTDFSGDSSGNEAGTDLAIQDDGMFVVAGLVATDGINDLDFALARYDQDGNLDLTFGT